MESDVGAIRRYGDGEEAEKVALVELCKLLRKTNLSHALVPFHPALPAAISLRG